MTSWPPPPTRRSLPPPPKMMSLLSAPTTVSLPKPPWSHSLVVTESEAGEAESTRFEMLDGCRADGRLDQQVAAAVGARSEAETHNLAAHGLFPQRRRNCLATRQLVRSDQNPAKAVGIVDDIVAIGK